MDYSDLTYEELVALAKDGDELAKNTIIFRFEPIILKIIKKKNYFLKGGEEDDLIQRGRMAVNSAINGYNDKHNSQTKFSTYANKCIINAFNSALRESKNSLLNDTDSLNGLNRDEDKNAVIADIRFNPEENAISQETELEQKQAIKEILSKFEYRVYELKELGYKNELISKELNCDKKAIENVNNRIKQKIAKIIETIKQKGLY